MRVVGALICLGVLVAGCGGTQQILRQTRGDKLYEAVSTHSSQVVSVIDSRSHTADRRLPMGVPTSDWSHLYSVASTSLVDTDPQTGATLSTMPLGGAYHLPAATANGVPGGLAPNGMWLVVESIDSSQSHMLIVNTTTSTVRRKIDLDGYFQFDAISNDGDRLYLIQHLNGREYYVRLYDVIGGRLDENIVVDKSDGNQAMVGTRLSGIATADGHMLFSMYVREHESPFIHALSLDGPFAFCLDLPGSGRSPSPVTGHVSTRPTRPPESSRSSARVRIRSHQCCAPPASRERSRPMPRVRVPTPRSSVATARRSWSAVHRASPGSTHPACRYGRTPSRAGMSRAWA